MEAYVVGYARTAFGSFGGRWKETSAVELASNAVREAIKRAALPSVAGVDELVLGIALPAGLGQCPAASVARLASLPPSVVAWEVGKVCASGMKAVQAAAGSVRLGTADIAVAVGAENMSRVPHAVDVRWGARFGAPAVSDLLQADGLTDAESGRPMGVCAEETAEAMGISREMADEYARRSFERALRFRAEIAAEMVAGGPQDDECVASVRPPNVQC